MKEKIIENILAEMSNILDTRQQTRLREVLKTTFEQVVMMPAESEEQQREQANGELLQAFISAKKIEGCSDKTLCYYQSSIEALLRSEQKRIRNKRHSLLSCSLSRRTWLKQSYDRQPETHIFQLLCVDGG